jgi:hypothetical protein
MQSANQVGALSESSHANGNTQLHELFALTDEQILEIDPEPQDVEVGAAGSSSSPESASEQRPGGNSEAGAFQEQNAQRTAPENEREQNPQARAVMPIEPPAWFAETMNDPQRGAEARALWEGAQRTEREVASYREVFAKPEEARAAADRARVLDDIDRAYFAGDASQRAQLAAMMMREDPAAFREMVFEGLRALEQAGTPVRNRSVAGALSGQHSAAPANAPARADSRQASSAPAAQSNQGTPQQRDSEQAAQLAAYAEFEKAANDDLERSVGSAIERTLEQALPSLGNSTHSSTNRALGVAAQHATPLQARLTAAIRQDIEKTLQTDRQLGEQVAQILSAKRLDAETRAQVVRLIAERAQQLVPLATKRALNDWTQTTLAAHRGKSSRGESPPRSEPSPAAKQSANRPTDATKTAPKSRQAENRSASSRAAGKSGRVNYQTLSDEQILDL